MRHARRRFHDAWIESTKQPGLAADAIKMLKKIYQHEKAYKQQNLTAGQRDIARLKEVGPRLEKMRIWAETNATKVLKSSTIGSALNYFVNEYTELSAFLKNDRYEIDNGWVEQMIRKFAIDRNNWLFSTSVERAKASGILYSVVLTAKLSGKDPFLAMTELLHQLPSAQTIDDYEKLARLLVNRE